MRYYIPILVWLALASVRSYNYGRWICFPHCILQLQVASFAFYYCQQTFPILWLDFGKCYFLLRMHIGFVSNFPSSPTWSNPNQLHGYDHARIFIIMKNHMKKIMISSLSMQINFTCNMDYPLQDFKWPIISGCKLSTTFKLP